MEKNLKTGKIHLDRLKEDLFQKEIEHLKKIAQEGNTEPDKDYLGISKESPEEIALEKIMKKGIELEVKELNEKLNNLKSKFEQDEKHHRKLFERYNKIYNQTKQFLDNIKDKNDYIVDFIKMRMDNLSKAINERYENLRKLEKEMDFIEEEIAITESVNPLERPQ